MLYYWAYSVYQPRQPLKSGKLGVCPVEVVLLGISRWNLVLNLLNWIYNIMPGKNNKFYITSSIAYTNAPPHIGFALEVVQADVLARYHRSLGEDVFYLTGTDEHGSKIAKAAAEAGKTSEKFTDELAEKFKKLTKELNLSNDDFIRTTDKQRHWPSVRKVWQELRKNGDLYKKKYKGYYCVGCEAFITEKDLVDGKCPNHQKAPEIVEEENYFFRLSKYSSKIEELIRKDELKIIPESRKNEMLNFINQGLEDVSFSRSAEKLKWGIPVPGDESQKVYVWADALTNYISALGFAKDGEKFKKYWPADIHCVGKDILRFHATIWPGMLLSLSLPLPKNIFVHGFITSGGQKMSKSLGNVIDPLALVDKYGADAVRYYLLREIPPTKDGDFTFQKFEERYNADLASGLGNLVARVMNLASQTDSPSTEGGRDIKKAFSEAAEEHKEALADFKFNEALVSIWEFITFCDRYIEQKKPWEEKENQKEIIGNLLFAINKIAELLNPFLPKTSEKILEQLKTLKAESLFPRIK